MAVELITALWCDRHMQEKDEKVHATPFTVAIGTAEDSAQEFKVELCEDCQTSLMEALTLVQTYGRIEGKRSKPRSGGNNQHSVADEDKVLCPIDGCGVRAINRSAMGHHLQRAHDTSYGELDGTATLSCREPGCKRKFEKPQGQAAHERSAHGLTPASQSA